METEKQEAPSKRLSLSSCLRRVGREESRPLGALALPGIYPTGVPRGTTTMARFEDVRSDRGRTHEQRTPPPHRQHSPDADKLIKVVRAHWGMENRLHRCLDVASNDDQMRARKKNTGANPAIVRRFVLNLFRLDKSRKSGIRTRRILVASSNSYREALLKLASV